MSNIVKSITNIFEAFEEYERRSNPYNNIFAAQFQKSLENKNFAAWYEAHENFDRPQRFRTFLKSRPDLVESIFHDEGMKEELEKAVTAALEKDKTNISVKGTISI